MRNLLILLIFLTLTACKSKVEMPEFITNDPEKLEEYADKALDEAQELLDSLENTPILNTEI